MAEPINLQFTENDSFAFRRAFLETIQAAFEGEIALDEHLASLDWDYKKGAEAAAKILKLWGYE